MNETVKKFRPERPIYLNTSNTKFKTDNEVIAAVFALRNERNENGTDRHWCAAFGEFSRPLITSFNDPTEFEQFRRDCEALKIELVFSNSISLDLFEEFKREEIAANPNAIDTEATSSDSNEMKEYERAGPNLNKRRGRREEAA